ncbi:hypothetical protein Pyn_02247 [Prunus yedoensis var. nudiflora]|uniref:Uncharacterized protein n=1 Tax=Prunus yedoensis var. nudiflora TaxID=2094558 RepID=A0A314YJH6_PRUYE|nr:hypothetical protein Pyn_02247 [Prunus yedoensis var. nudiflora]
MGTQMQFEIYIESAFTDEFDSQKATRHQLRSSSKKKNCVRRGFLTGNVKIFKLHHFSMDRDKFYYESEIARVLFLLLLFLDAQDQKH